MPIKNESKTSFPPNWLLLLEERLRDEYQTNLRTCDLAKWLGVHPVYLARVFRKHYHTSIKTFLQERRIENVMQGLIASPTSLAHLAYDNGFADQSHLNRVFKKVIQTSPGKFRDLVKGF